MDANANPAADPIAAAVPRLRRFARVLMGGSSGADELVLATITAARNGPAAALEIPIGLFGMMHAFHRRDPRANEAPAARAANDLCARVLQLPLDEREVLMLVAVERLSYMDVAKVLDVPVATVMSALTRAREHLAGRQA